jgi:hypothetical protein
MGNNKFRTRGQLLEQKVFEIKRLDSEAAAWGHEHEAEVTVPLKPLQRAQAACRLADLLTGDRYVYRLACASLRGLGISRRAFRSMAQAARVLKSLHRDAVPFPPVLGETVKSA